MNQENPIDYKNRWLFDITEKPAPQACELSFGRTKAYLYENLHRSISRLNSRNCFRLLKVLPKETSLDPYVLFRFILILVESNPTENLNKNVLIYLDSLFSKLDLSRPEVFVELLAYFIRHNRISDAKELFAQRHRHMTKRIHRSVPYLDVNLRCYEFYLNYLDWNAEVSSRSSKISFDVSIQGWIVNAIESLRTTVSNHEYFVMCVAHMLLYYGFTKKAYLFLSEFQRCNPNNMSAQLLHYNLLNQLENIQRQKGDEVHDPDINMDCLLSGEERESHRSNELKTINNFTSGDETIELNKFPVSEDKRSILNNLNRLDPSRDELTDPVNMSSDPIRALRYLLDSLEVVSEVGNVARWISLQGLIENIFSRGDEVLASDARFLWRYRYKQFWSHINFSEVIGGQISEHDRELIREVSVLVQAKLDN